jgi:imidazolonepropionase-like amidohydrolase
MGPRLQVAHAPITVPGGHAHAMGGVAQGVEGVRGEVRKRAAEGADLIKVMSTGGFMTAGSHPSEGRYTVEELEAVKDEATKFGMPVTTHATGTEGIEKPWILDLIRLKIALGLVVSSFSCISSI